jgi:elongation factor P
MYTTSDLRKGLRVEMDGVPYVITEFQFNKPGKGQAIYICRLKNMITGQTMQKSFREVDRIEKPNLDERRMTFSHTEGDEYVFMDSRNFEQVSVSTDVLGDSRFLLNEDLEVQVLFFNDRPVDVTLPSFVEKEIVHTDPGARGNTATNVLKAAKITGGYEIQVPLFVNQGDVIRIDTRTGAYAERVTKK